MSPLRTANERTFAAEPTASTRFNSARNWLLSLLAAALVVTVLGIGIAIIYPLMFTF